MPIADVQMPGLSGIELQHHIIQQGHHIPIIFVTAHPEDRLRTQATKQAQFEFQQSSSSVSVSAPACAIRSRTNRRALQLAAGDMTL